MGSSSNSGKMTPEPVGFVLFNLSNVEFVDVSLIYLMSNLSYISSRNLKCHIFEGSCPSICEKLLCLAQFRQVKNFVGWKKWRPIEFGKSIHDASLAVVSSQNQGRAVTVRMDAPPFQKPKSSKNSQPLGLNVYTFVQTETQMTSNEIKIPVDQNLDDAKFPLITFTNVDIKASSNQPLGWGASNKITTPDICQLFFTQAQFKTWKFYTWKA